MLNTENTANEITKSEITKSSKFETIVKLAKHIILLLILIIMFNLIFWFMMFVTDKYIPLSGFLYKNNPLGFLTLTLFFSVFISISVGLLITRYLDTKLRKLFRI